VKSILYFINRNKIIQPPFKANKRKYFFAIVSSKLLSLFIFSHISFGFLQDYKMIFIKIITFSILKLACANLEKVQHYFKVSKNQSIDLAASEMCFLSSFNTMGDLLGLASCNFNQECLTVVFIQSKGLITNCFMYNRY
jgi:hypothetical protein